MVTRMEGGVTYIENYDADCEAPPKGGNRLVSVNVSGQSQPTPFIYDGDGNLVKQIKPDGNKTLYVGGIYEVNKNAGGSVTGTKTYYPAAGAMRDGSTLYYVLKDHLGSASVLTDASGATVAGAETRYYPFGEARFTGPMVTDKLFTGKRQIAELGIYHYQARFYSPKLGRFLSADTIVPGYANPQSWNRYSYVVNNPLRYTDPTGHRCAPDDDCGGAKYSNASRVSIWKKRIKSKFGIEMSDDKGEWNFGNLYIVYTGLSQANKYLGGNAKSIVDGSIFYLKSAADSTYSGLTSGMKITSSTSSTIPFQNLYHEFAHLLDNGLNDAITNQLGKRAFYYQGEYLFGGNGIGEISTSTLTDTWLDDPYRANDVRAIQHASRDPVEQWADMFANLVAGNIDIDQNGPGRIMYTWTRSLLYPHVGLP